MEMKFGWRKDPYDARDYLHKPKLLQIPNAVSLRALLPPVRNQGAVGACVGFGIAVNLGGVAAGQKAFSEWFSPTWIYNGARFIEGTLTQDVGAAPGDALSWLQKNGTLLEHFWPYSANLDQSAPSSLQMSEVNKYPDFAYYRCVDGPIGIASALADAEASYRAGGPAWLVSIGTPWFDKWYSQPIPADGVLPAVTASDAVVGGHETCLSDYDLTTAMFYGQNSWGTPWGDKGRYWMPFEAFDTMKQIGGYDAQYIKFTMTSVPVKKCFVLDWLKNRKEISLCPS
jgi:hypothetical protein